MSSLVPGFAVDRKMVVVNGFSIFPLEFGFGWCSSWTPAELVTVTPILISHQVPVLPSPKPRRVIPIINPMTGKNIFDSSALDTKDEKQSLIEEKVQSLAASNEKLQEELTVASNKICLLELELLESRETGAQLQVKNSTLEAELTELNDSYVSSDEHWLAKLKQAEEKVKAAEKELKRANKQQELHSKARSRMETIQEFAYEKEYQDREAEIKALQEEMQEKDEVIKEFELFNDM
jgi:hypothetical protein